jgi:hypothetical protein
MRQLSFLSGIPYKLGEQRSPGDFRFHFNRHFIGVVGDPYFYFVFFRENASFTDKNRPQQEAREISGIRGDRLPFGASYDDVITFCIDKAVD